MSALFMAALCAAATMREPLDFVDPLIGTASRRADAANAAAMQPFVGVPFGMWQWTVMTQLSELGKVSYADASRQFLGFIGTRQPAPWMGEYGQLSVQPQVGPRDCSYATRGVPFNPADCIFTPYYCRVALANGIVAEATGSPRCALLRFSFPNGQPGRLVFDASREFVARFSDTNAMPGQISFADAEARLLRAWNEDRADAKLGPPLRNCRARFRVEVSRPAVAHGVYVGDGPRGADGYRTARCLPDTATVTADVCGAWAEYASSGEPLLVKISQSMIDDAQADDTMCRELGDGFDFEAAKARAKAAWTRALAVLEIEADEDVKTIFYTGMYHALQFPREFGEYGRYYSAFDDTVHAGDSYTSYSLWDTYRAEHAFLALAAPGRVDGMMTALLQMYKEGGWLPKWPNPAYTGVMVGDPAAVVLAQAYACGFRGFDLDLAYEAVKHNATVPSPADTRVAWWGREPWTGGPEARGGLTAYQTLGYVAADKTTESVSRTLDFGHADLAVAVLADAVGKADEAKAFRARAKNYRNLWNPGRRKFWPRRADGTWLDAPHDSWRYQDYTEQSPETAVWGVPYDVAGIAELVGGKTTLEAMLDEYFDTIYYNKNGGEMTHHENEPTHHIAYLYAALGRPDKCARHVRRILARGYSSERWGMEGNDDCGQMSAWYILSSLGFYPLDPTTGEYVIGSPLVRAATLRIGTPFPSATFRVVVQGQSRTNVRVKSVKLNGVELSTRRIRHADIVRGGVLEFEMEGGNDLPPLVGDGVADDTAAIQARLDAGLPCVYLPPPPKGYLISKTLRIGSDTELRLDRFTEIRLAPGSDCPMIENRGYVGGRDRRIALTGGIWNMANLDQSPNPQQLRRCTPPRAGGLPPRHENDFFFGMAMRFSNVEGLTAKGLTVRNPTSYGLALCRTSYFLVDDITFDYVTRNPIFLNMDGVHLDGWCHHGRISNLRGTCFDDLVALNANDGQCAQAEGDIHDIDIEGLYADYCHSAVRLLSTGANLKRVTIRNVHGNFYTYAVGLTHFFGDRKTRGVFDDIVVRDVFAGKALAPADIGMHSRTNFPLVWVEGAVDVGRLTVENFSRDERTVNVATLRVDGPATVGTLVMRDCRMSNALGSPIPFLDIQGKVGRAVVENADFLPAPSDWTRRDVRPQAPK